MLAVCLTGMVTPIAGCGGDEGLPQTDRADSSRPTEPSEKGSQQVLWSGDYETGNLDQWSTRQAVPSAIELTRRVRRQGRYAARFEVRPGDDPIDARGERAELVTGVEDGGGREGQNAWYGWSTYLPRNLQPTVGDDATNIFTQWHHQGSRPAGATVPPIRFSIDTGNSDPNPFHWFLRVAGGTSAPYSFQEFDLGQVVVEAWVDFVFHVNWSADPRKGFVELWINGRKVVPKTSIATVYAGRSNYLKQGWYRTESSATSVIYHDAMRRGTSREAVDPRRKQSP